MITIAGPGDLAPRRPLFNDAAREQDAELAGYTSSLAERRIREFRKIVEQQRALVARYKAADRDASSSEALLSEIQKSLDAFEKDYLSIQAEVEALRGHNDAVTPTLTEYLAGGQVV